jgi:hypothetical protein
MKGRINLFFLVPRVELCGVSTYTVHLYKVGNTTRSASFMAGLSIHTVTLPDAHTMCQSDPSLITYCFWPKSGMYAKPLLREGVPLVIHDPAEFLPEATETMRKFGTKPIVIRKTNVAGLGKHGINSTFIPHPYTPAPPSPGIGKDMHAVSLARVDGRKRTETIVAANKLLPPERTVRIFGNINRIYEFHVLRKKHPEWRKWYGGTFPTHWGAAVQLAERANFSVDMTGIPGDGGGTQYTFFETWNAGVPLVLSREWLAHEGVCKENVNCLAAGSAEELAAVLRSNPDFCSNVVDGGRAVLKQHAPETVVPIYEEVCKWITK